MTDFERTKYKNEILYRIKNGTCQVLGAGISNIPLVKWLLSKGARVVVRDQKPIEKLDNAGELASLGATLIGGENYLSDLSEQAATDKTLIFRSPGMRHDKPEIARAVENGAILTSEMELFLLLAPANVIAITGSDGKTTTTTLSGMFMECFAKGKTYVGGNIGKPLLPKVEEMTENDFAVIELSSFQLQTFRHSVKSAVITNITPNHLNWHIDMEEYTQAKYNIFLKGGCERLVVNSDNDGSLFAAYESQKLDKKPKLSFFSLVGDSYENVVPEYAREMGSTAIFLKRGILTVSDGKSEQALFDMSEIKIPGMHNVANYMTAILACLDYITDFDKIRQIAGNFGGVAHRLELVRMLDGVKYYNSSIDSTPTRTAAALSALREDPIVICGGQDKGVSFLPLAEVLCSRASAVILTGQCREKILSAFEEYEGYDRDKLPIFICPDFEDAVKKAREIAKEGDTVLLSPACTSFDVFKNFEERGNKFKEIVKSF